MVWSYTRLGAGALLLLLAVIFSVQNAGAVQLDFLFWTIELSQALVIFLALIAGAASGALLGGRLYRRHRA